MAGMARHDQEHDQRPLPEELPAWPNMWGDQRQWWVDGVPVPRITAANAFAAGIVAPLGAWVAATDPAGWLASLVALLGTFFFSFVVMSWAMRIADLRDSREQ